ncbi:MAG TPA: MscL family protein [Candidatus Paceibacterota bacterium]
MVREQIRGQLIGFVDFVRERGVMGLAIGFIMGGAISKVTTALSTDIINPIVALLFGSIQQLSDIAIGTITFGHFLATLLDFLVLAIVVYLMFKVLGLDRLDKPKE